MIKYRGQFWPLNKIFFLGSFIELRPKKSTYLIFLIVAPYSPSKNLSKKTKKGGVTM